MAKQPFYHRVDGLMFTCTESLTEDEFILALKLGLSKMRCVYVKDSVEVEEWHEPEAGDPDDL